MAARTWFTKDNTPPDVNLRIINCAARLLADDARGHLGHRELTAIRMSYASNLSPLEVYGAACAKLDSE